MYEHRPARRERGRTDRNARHTDLIQRQKQKSSPPIQPRLLLRDCGLPIPECPLPAYFEKDVPTLRGFLSCRFILLCKQVAYLVILSPPRMLGSSATSDIAATFNSISG